MTCDTEIAELLEKTETELRREKAAHEGSHRALADAMMRLNATAKERNTALSRLESEREQHATDVAGASFSPYHAFPLLYSRLLFVVLLLFTPSPA